MPDSATQLSEFYLATIVEVGASFGFMGFLCHPSEITSVLELAPTLARREGEQIALANGKHILAPTSEWTLFSTVDSKDVNVHLRELLGRLGAVSSRIRSVWGSPSFSVLWKGNYLYAGNGPFYEKDVIAGIAALGADLWQDIYQVDDGVTSAEEFDGLERIPRGTFRGGRANGDHDA